MTRAFQQAGELARGIGMVFDQEDAQGTGRRRQPRPGADAVVADLDHEFGTGRLGAFRRDG